MNKLKNNLLFKIVVAIIIGITIGTISQELGTPEENISYDWIVRLFVTCTALFGSFLKFIVPLIIIGLVAPGIADLGRGGGRLLAMAVGLAFVSTITGGVIAMFVGIDILPNIVDLTPDAITEGGNKGMSLLKPFFTIEIPPVMGTITAIVLAFSLGIGMIAIDGKVLHNAMNELKSIVEMIIKKVIITLLPIYILGIFANMAYSGEVWELMRIFGVVIACAIVLHFVILTIEYSIAGSITGRSPIKLLKNMMSAYFTAAATQSSAATIPVTLAGTKKNGVRESIANFTIPLLATIHLTGSAISLTLFSLTLMYINGMPIETLTYMGFLLMLAITVVAAPAIPGGTIMASLGILESILGFDEKSLSLMVALYITQESFGTACNAAGDGALSIIINRLAGFKLEKKSEI